MALAQAGGGGGHTMPVQLSVECANETSNILESQQQQPHIPNTQQLLVPTHNNRAKASKFLAFCQQLTLRRLFHLIGFSIGTYPLAYLIAAVIIAGTSGGMYFLKLEDRVRDGYTPATSPSRYETDVLREFLHSVGDPTLTTVVLRSRDGGSMHRLRQLEEAVRLHTFLMGNLTATVPLTGEQVIYGNICGSYCNTNIVIEYFYRALLDELERDRLGKDRTRLTNLTYPIAKIAGFDIHLERSFYGVRLRRYDTSNSAPNDSISDDVEVSRLSRVTDIEDVHIILMIFRGDIPSVEMEAKLNAWEMAVYNFATINYTNQDVEMLVLGAEIVNHELINDSQKMTAYFATGFAAMFVFVAATVVGGATYNGVMDAAKLFVAFGATVCPILAITVTFGVYALASLRTNTIMLIMPFLIMGIGVNDAFLMIHCWQRLSSDRIVNERLGLVLEEVGPSITITTLTNVITFGIGALTPTPEISLFCMATAIALGFAYIFTLVLFGPILYLATILEGKRKKSAARALVNAWIRRALKLYCGLISQKVFGVVLLIVTLVYWYFGVIGTLNIKTRLDVEKLLPKDSPLQEANGVISNLVWTEYYPVTILVNNPIDIRDKYIMDEFNAMVEDFEAMDKCKGNLFRQQYTMLWLRDYMTYWRDATLYDFDFYEDSDAIMSTTPFAVDPLKTGIDYSRLGEFLQSPIYKHWVSFMRLRNDTELPVEKFWLTVAYHNATSWNDRIELMQQWRVIVHSYKRLNATVWEANSMFVDQMLSLKTLTLQTGIWTLVCMTAVCALFIQNPFSVLVASMAIASISLGVVGYLSWWHLDLDPATLCAILMSIGMSVDFTAHVSYHYQLRKRKKMRDNRVVKVALKNSRKKLEYTLECVAWPMTQAGLSTVTCVLPLIFLQASLLWC
ncbi:Patched domain-containing protein 3 [Toxocara canis]|uniref:Patched domain-containing protein 3 n=1 Tax=Toxocara canis TaxID=6265 RepID=A0A0B2UI13_TOXCA|nr:Patched domain-containing protein 3 [Toxocara canis]